MENFEDHMNNKETVKPDGLDKAFETTYLVVTGKIKLESLGGTGREIFMLYDPLSVEKTELKEILNDIIEYYIEIEEYEKCQEIKELLDSSLDELIPKITYSDDDVRILPQPDHNKENSIDKMIDILRNIASAEKKGAKMHSLFSEKKDEGEITIEEFWSLLSEEDKLIFSNQIPVFIKWAHKLSKKQTGYYIERLVHGKSLIPPFEGFESGPLEAGTWPIHNENKKYSIEDVFEGEEDVDYDNKVVISFIDNLTCISNYDLLKINRIRFQLLNFGILETEIRIKQIENRKLYTLVYDSQQNINKIDWN